MNLMIKVTKSLLEGLLLEASSRGPERLGCQGRPCIPGSGALPQERCCKWML